MLKHEREGLWWMDNHSVSRFERGRGGGGLHRVEIQEGDGQPLWLTFRVREGWWWPPSCQNTRRRGCGGWTSSVSHFKRGRVVVRVSGGGDQQQTMLLITIKSIKLIELK